MSFALGGLVDKARAEAEAAAEVVPRIVLRPKAVNDSGFRVVTEGGTYGTLYRVLGEKPERWVEQTDFQNDEAVGYLADRLQKIGIEDALVKAGAVAGSTNRRDLGPALASCSIQQTLTTAAEVQVGTRGSDSRIDFSERRTSKERREKYHELMDAKAEARAQLQRERESGMWSEEQ